MNIEGRIAVVGVMAAIIKAADMALTTMINLAPNGSRSANLSRNEEIVTKAINLFDEVVERVR